MVLQCWWTSDRRRVLGNLLDPSEASKPYTGAGRIHECLRNNREQLTSRCAEEEAKLESAQVRKVEQPAC